METFKLNLKIITIASILACLHYPLIQNRIKLKTLLLRFR